MRFWMSAAIAALIPMAARAQDKQAEQRVGTVVKSISWADDLEKAKAAAAKAQRPIFWLNVVGELDGKT